MLPLAMLPAGQGQLQESKQPIVPAARIVPAELPLGKFRDGTKLPLPAQPIFKSAHLAMHWLKLANKSDGRFVYGFLPALRVAMEGDNFLSQAGATYALARATRYFQDERGTAVARQAALTLLLETATDPKDPTVRWTAAPPAVLNRLATSGLLVLAIHELAVPGKDLLDQAEQLCNGLRRQQLEDGQLVSGTGHASAKGVLNELDVQHAGTALHALARSHKLRPADWKLDMVRKARSYYQARWQASKNMTTVISHTPGCVEAYLLTKEPAFAETVFAMNDWLAGLQYPADENPSRKGWLGGFPRCSGGTVESVAPDITSAQAAESLAEACRVAKVAGDIVRLRRYERALLLNLHFVMSLQYTGGKVEHFVENFRPAILGAFYASHQDGNLRLDYTQHPLCAMVQYLDAVIE
jgi:hypothetical protein